MMEYSDGSPVTGRACVSCLGVFQARSAWHYVLEVCCFLLTPLCCPRGSAQDPIFRTPCAAESQPPAPWLTVQGASRYQTGRDSSAKTNPAPWEQRETEHSNHFCAQPLLIVVAACSSSPSQCSKSTCHPVCDICQCDTLQIAAWVSVSRNCQAWEAGHCLLLPCALRSEQRKPQSPSAVGGSQAGVPAPA